jgi:hypothetical protein
LIRLNTMYVKSQELFNDIPLLIQYTQLLLSRQIETKQKIPKLIVKSSLNTILETREEPVDN